jgi:uncharacterized protein
VRRFERCRTLEIACPSGARLDVWVAASAFARLVGLCGLESLPSNRALLIPRCRSVHTLGMRFAIDVAFVVPANSALFEIAALRRCVQPRRVVAARGSALAALELRAGGLERLALERGSLLRCTGPAEELRIVGAPPPARTDAC